MAAKPIVVRLQDSEGKVYRWKVERLARAYCVLSPGKGKFVSGWTYTDHEGYGRFAEGNWQDLVFRFKTTAENYGLQLMSELS